MTIDDAINKCKSLGLNVFIWHDLGVDISFGKIKFGRLRYVMQHYLIHSHWWKVQDDDIDNVSVEKWEKALNEFIHMVKEYKLKLRIEQIENIFKND